jgi:ribosomal protein S18 acetylase RimI-like enzyme
VDAVRKATSDDVPALAGALARAFHDDPVISWMFSRDASRPRWATRFFAIRLRQLLAQDEVYALDGGGGAAGWTRPDEWALSLRETAQLSPILPGLGTRAVRVLRGLARVEHHHPRDQHYYLAHLGVEPPAQGDGLGSALLEPVLRSCDEDGVAAYLESSKERNIAFYARHGFRVTEEVRLPGGPPIWLMWREPRGGG